MTPRPQCFTLSEAVISLYRADASGAPVLTQAVWIGAQAHNLRLNDRLEEVLHWPTAATHKDAYHTDQDLEIEVERLWALPATSLTDYAPERNARYVLEILWQDNLTQRWFRRWFYGVTWRSQDRSSRGLMELGGTQVFRAQWCSDAADAGPYPTPAPAAPSTLRVFYHDGSELWPLYSYSTSTHIFSEITAGSATGRAAITKGVDTTQISLGSNLSLEAASGELKATEFTENYRPDGPELVFQIGQSPIARLSAARLYAPQFIEDTPTAAVDRFAIYAGANLIATIGPLGVTALALTEW